MTVGDPLSRSDSPVGEALSLNQRFEEMAPNPYLKAIAPDAARSKPAPRRSNGGNAPTTAKTNGSAAAAAKQARAPVDETLRQEILALGGDDADLDLLAGIDSDSELEGGDDDEDEGEQQQPAAKKANKVRKRDNPLVLLKSQRSETDGCKRNRRPACSRT